jgi:hypothetical protein
MRRGSLMKYRYLLALFLLALVVASIFVLPSHGGFSLSPSRRPQLPAPAAPSGSSAHSGSSPALWISPAVPVLLHRAAQAWSIPIVDDRSSASLRLDMANETQQGSAWIYVLVTPFPTVIDGVTFNELRAGWNGTPVGQFADTPLLMDDSTLGVFTALWGEPAAGAVRTLPADQLLDAAWAQRPAWAIVPFESLDPRWKVLSVDGQSPVQKDFEPYRYHLMQASFDYPLSARFALICTWPCPLDDLPTLPATNRDPARLTTLVMTGVTALVRATAFTMNTKGITYPGRDIRDWMLGADITHISNEVPFANDCPPPDPTQTKRLVFCSDPRYIELLTSLGTDVVELTGNHYADYGPEAMLLTLQLYGQNGMAHYGGGANLEDARKPLLLENKGNKLAFIGCNSVDIGRMPTATKTRPGAAPCDYDYMTSQIRALHDQGYLVIVSFQYYETYDPKPFDQQLQDFRMMADAGAVIVQGSQSHNPQTLEFRNGGLIHYGLGNLFFDQMGNAGTPTRKEFIDRHVFYDGRYISTQLLTAELEDYARPRPMTAEERSAFLSQYFSLSGW